ncbi:MAG: RimK family protein [Gammaproteobacteria bacterium]|nr:RimK family protein [Gammaproteobacteria bacterium]
MSIIVVVDDPREWLWEIPGVDVVSSRQYLVDPSYSELRGAKIFNLSRSYRYQSLGYYVSLLATSRGHKPLPSISTIQDMKSPAVARVVSEELEDLIHKSLAHLHSAEFVLSIYFGRNMAKRYDRLAHQLFSMYPAPLLRARFVNDAHGWQLQSITPIAAKEIPKDHHDFVVQMAKEYFSGRRAPTKRRKQARFDLAILHNPDEEFPPSEPRSLKRFIKAAESVGFSVEMITRHDYGRLAEFDALFIRETTNVGHHTFRFAQRAAAEGLVVIDDPDSILRCSNKVYLAELMARNRIRHPKTYIVTKENLAEIAEHITLPSILKQPDSAFSMGVYKVDSSYAFKEGARNLLTKSELIIAQNFLPTDYDWRIGILDGKPLYACKYFMAAQHWQVMRKDKEGVVSFGKSETMRVEDAPPHVIKTALRAANLIGNGLYGVDLKQVGDRCYVIEVNDNPNIDVGVEDGVLGMALYEHIMGVMMQRVEASKRPYESVED